VATVGVLALQGGFAPHLHRLSELGHTAREVRSAVDLAGLDGIVLPGGESTTQLQLLERAGLIDPLCAFRAAGRPILATCAGLILAAQYVAGPAQTSLGWLPISVRRNGWGRQLDSFRAVADEDQVPLVFIRAPRITDAGEAETVLRYRGEPVLVRMGAVFGATFHPELTGDPRIHRWVFGET
jgi:pyridoxal 5'-phosphate synthase pdxT subunit